MREKSVGWMAGAAVWAAFNGRAYLLYGTRVAFNLNQTLSLGVGWYVLLFALAGCMMLAGLWFGDFIRDPKTPLFGRWVRELSNQFGQRILASQPAQGIKGKRGTVLKLCVALAAGWTVLMGWIVVRLFLLNGFLGEWCKPWPPGLPALGLALSLLAWGYLLACGYVLILCACKALGGEPQRDTLLRLDKAIGGRYRKSFLLFCVHDAIGTALEEEHDEKQQEAGR